MSKTIRHELFFPQDAAVVWEYLTQPDLIAQWLMKNDFELKIGHQFTFCSNPAPSIDFDGIVYCTVLEIVPMQKLSYSWKCGPGKGKITVDSVVNWTLEPDEEGTLVTIEHNGFKVMENMNMFAAMEQGWLKHLHMIAAQIKEKNGVPNS